MFKACFVITESCNLSCEYCYMKNRSTYMDRETFDYHYKTTLPFFMQHYNQSTYELDMFGGEPLKNWFMVSHIIHHTKNDPKLKSLNLITNGLLLNDQRVEILKKNKVKCSLSFDGLWAQHLKKYLSLKPLLQKLFNSCSVCVTPRYMNMAENFRFLLDEFQLIPKFKVVRDDIWSKDDVEKFKFELNKLEEIYLEYLNKTINVFPLEYQLLLMLESRLHPISKLRCFAGNSGAAFGPDKKVYPCARFLSERSYPIYDQEVMIDNLEDIDKIANVYSEDCKQCSQHDFCINMCLHQEMKHGGLLTNVCDVHKATVEKIIDINHELKNNEIWRGYIKENMNGQK